MTRLILLSLISLSVFSQTNEVVFIGSIPANTQMSTGVTVAAKSVTGGTYNYRCDSVADQVQINQAISDAAQNPYGGTVYLSPGKFVINGWIRIKSNVRLVSTPQTHIYLAYNANCYMLINDDTENGNEGFIIDGGRWYGRAPQQTRDYPTVNETPDEGFFGWGFVFHLCNNVIIQNTYIEDTEAWAIAYFHCDNIKFLNNEIVQLQVKGNNQDGITGNSNKNVLIDGLIVACADDPIAMGCTQSHLGYLGNPPQLILWGDGYDCENLTFRNIYSNKVNDTTWGFPPIGLYPAEGRTIRNVVIENVYGGSQYHNYGMVHILNAFTNLGKGYVDGLSISKVDMILADSVMNILQLGAYGQTDGVANYLSVKNLAVSDVIARVEDPNATTLFELSSCIENATFDNISCFDRTGTKHKLMTIDSDVDTIIINVGSVDPVNQLDNTIYDLDANSSVKVRVNAPNCKIAPAKITMPIAGDRVIDSADEHPLIYLNGAWVDLYE